MQWISCGMAILTRQSPEAMTSERTPSMNALPEFGTRYSFPGLSLVKSPVSSAAASPTLQAAPPGVRQPFPTGTVTLLFSDIEGSTRLLQHLGGTEYARVLGAHRRLLRTAFRAWDGQEVDTAGDGCFTVFERARTAAAAAVAAQRALAAYPWPADVRVRVRMGLHTGEPALFEEGYVGLDVHLAARICAAAQGGQILLSRTTRELVERELPTGMHLLEVGPYRLKGLDRPEYLSELQAATLPCGNRAQERSAVQCHGTTG